MIIHLIRHTTPDIEAGICYGQTDMSLADSFEQEADAVLSKLLDRYDVVYTSPLQRCALLAAKLESPNLINDDRLMEYNFGDWELIPWDDFKSETAQSWMNNFVDQAAPNGDNMLSMQARVSEFWTDLLKSKHQQVAIVTHSGVQRLIHGHVLETPLSHLFRLQLGFGAILEVNSDEKSGLLTVKHL
ncbi:MAG: alpha-ribazole phosphatase [Arenicella sp.]|nr:alpha-ribazole phosphatase [Arenicella sp.]